MRGASARAELSLTLGPPTENGADRQLCTSAGSRFSEPAVTALRPMSSEPARGQSRVRPGAEATIQEDSGARPEADDMAKLIYSAIGSLDGYVEDASGKFEWAAPDEEVHAFVNELERPIGTYLYGRRMYETMVFWETVDPDGDWPAVAREFAAIWQAAEKIVYSRTLETVSSARTRIEHESIPHDPADEAELGF